MKRSKVLSILLAVMMVLSSMSCLSVVSFAANLVESGYTPDSADAENPGDRIVAWEFYDNGILYIYEDPGSVAWAKYSNDITSVVVKSGVTSILPYAFYGCSNLINVDLSEATNVSFIGNYAFNGCSAVTSISLPNSVSSLGDYAFYACSALQTVRLSPSLQSVGKNVFKGCQQLATVTVPNGATVIGYGMFEDCTSLAAINLPDSVALIDAHAFEGCSSITDVVIPDSVKTIGDYAFYESGAQTAYIGHNVESVGSYIFGRCSDLKEVTFTSGIKTISDWMFYGCSALTTIVDFPESVSVIGAHAFEGCSALTEIAIPNTVTEIYDSAFAGCSSLATIELSTSLNTIGANAFNGAAITVINIPYGVNSIGAGAFSSCTSLTAINVDRANASYRSDSGILYSVDMSQLIACPAGKTGDVVVSSAATAIGANAFMGCELITSVEIPASVTSIDATSFNGCSNALVIKTICNSAAAQYAKIFGISTDITHTGETEWVVTTNPTCETAGSREQRCADCDYVITTEIVAPLGHNYDSGVVTLKPTCEADGVMTYTCQNDGCTDFYTSPILALGHNYDNGTVILEPTCDTNGIKRFRCQNEGCTSAYDYDIPATGHNYDAGTITTPATCDTDGEKLYVCQDAACGHSYTEVIPALGHNYDAGTITTPATCEVAGVMTYACQNEGCSHTTTSIIPATGHNYDNGTITKHPTVNENGEITYTCKNEWCTEEHANHTYVVYIPNTAFDGLLDTNEGAYADENGNIQNLTWLLTDTYDLYVLADDTVEEWVKHRGSIVTVTYAGNATTVDNSSFAYAPELKEANILLSEGTIEAYAFQQCPKLETVQTGSIATIENFAFYDCNSLKEVYIYGGFYKDQVGTNVFNGCDALTDVTLGNGTIELGYAMFKDCAALEEITLPASLLIIGDSAFDGTSLKTIKIPTDIEEIGKGAFTNCAALTAINVDNKNDYYFSVDGVLYDMELGALVLCPAKKTGEVTVWDGTTSIADDAFIGCKLITKVSIPDSVVSIAENAFNNCATALVIKGNCDSYGIKYAKHRGIATEINHVASSVWQITKEANCLEEGTRERVCEGCGYVYETQVIEALGHDYDDGVVTTKATCEAAGVMTFTCTRDNCSASYTEVIPALMHNYDTGRVISAATCESDGTMRYSCQNAGCLNYYDEVIPATGHNMDVGTITTPATCEADGEKVYKCQNTGCLYTETEVIPATGHSYNSGVVTTSATCTENGVLTFTCQNTGCTSYYTEVIPATGHNYVAVEIKKATCIENGKIQHTCANCGDYYTEITTGDHMMYSTPVKVNPTCTEPGKEGNMCAVCHKFIGETTVIPATGHTYVNGICSGCGDKKGTQNPSNPGTEVLPENPGPEEITLATPKLLLLKNQNEGLVLTWKEVEGATGYRVYRRSSGAKSWTYLETVADCTYTDSTATTGQYWRYTVRAVNSTEMSGFENGIYIKRVATPHLTAISNTASGVRVSWSSISNAKSYRVYRRGAGESWKLIATVTGTSYVDTSIKANSGNYYRYTVRAVDGYYSAFESGLLIKYVAAPHLTGIKNTSNGVKVDWNAVSGADSYRVYRREAGKSWVYVTTVTGTSYVDTSVKDATGYYKYTVRAVDGAYSGFESGLLIKK